MQNWQSKFIRSLVLLAVALVLVAGSSAAELWTFYDKNIVLYHRDPTMATFSIGGVVFSTVACLGAAVFCLNLRRSMLRHEEKMKQLGAKSLR